MTTRTIVGCGMYGMFGPVTDPGEREFTTKVEALGVNINASPYRDYEVDKIVAVFNAAPPDAIRLLWGSSLGANNCPVVARHMPGVIIHGMWGFQASDGGAKVSIPSNVLFAHEVWNPLWIQTAGLGAYEWVLMDGNTVTSLHTDKHYDFHPGETEEVQTTFLAEMQRVISNPGS